VKTGEGKRLAFGGKASKGLADLTEDKALPYLPALPPRVIGQGNRLDLPSSSTRSPWLAVTR